MLKPAPVLKPAFLHATSPDGSEWIVPTWLEDAQNKAKIITRCNAIEDGALPAAAVEECLIYIEAKDKPAAEAIARTLKDAFNAEEARISDRPLFRAKSKTGGIFSTRADIVASHLANVVKRPEILALRPMDDRQHTRAAVVRALNTRNPS